MPPYTRPLKEVRTNTPNSSNFPKNRDLDLLNAKHDHFPASCLKPASAKQPPQDARHHGGAKDIP
jgi:hypothetical protein